MVKTPQFFWRRCLFADARQKADTRKRRRCGFAFSSKREAGRRSAPAGRREPAGNGAHLRPVERERRVVARIEATPQGLDIRYVVTSLEAPTPETIYATLYCARGQAENLIKLHKTQLKSDRTSCRSPLANQMRLVLHTAAYWLMLAVRDAIPKTHALAKAEFATIRARLLKLGARIVETTHRGRVAFAAACPDAHLIRALAVALRPAPA